VVVTAVSGAVQAAVTRTPLSTAVCLAVLTHTTEKGAGTLLPVVLTASYVSVFCNWKFKFFRTQEHRVVGEMLHLTNFYIPEEEEDVTVDIKEQSLQELPLN